MTNEDYHKHPALSNSGISLLLDRPSKYYHQVILEERESTAAMTFGSAFHCAVLEPERYAVEYATNPHDGRTKSGKEWAANNTNKTILSSADAELIEKMRDGIGKNALARTLIMEPGLIEESYFWTDIITGVVCKCRPDKIVTVDERVIVLDLKTTDDASPESFAKSVANYGYHRQAYWYVFGLDENIIAVDEFIFVACEKKPPHECALYVIDPCDIERARAQCDYAIDLFSRCKERNNWPGLGDKITTVSLPAWYKQEAI